MFLANSTLLIFALSAASQNSLPVKMCFQKFLSFFLSYTIHKLLDVSFNSCIRLLISLVIELLLILLLIYNTELFQSVSSVLDTSTNSELAFSESDFSSKTVKSVICFHLFQSVSICFNLFLSVLTVFTFLALLFHFIESLIFLFLSIFHNVAMISGAISSSEGNVPSSLY
jgi:hypothetical protein